MAQPGPAVALALAALVALAAWRLRALGGAGALAAVVVGTAVLGGAGWAGGLVLLAFFVGSSAVGRLLPRRLPDATDAKGERRDPWQVAANGGAAAVGALVGGPAALWVVTGALAAAGADTWATAWGAGSATAPRHLLTGRVVPPGTSGGITPRGTLGAALGALVVAGAAGLAAGARLAVAGTLVGLVGMFLDSALGAAVQGRFNCPACGVPSEWRRHRCGARTDHAGGWAWLTNDGVNALATSAGAVLGWGAWRWLAAA